ncbi:MAG TPA: polysaccharide deacetylase family protein [Gemmatimonadota bacterium]|nr:polysaccharide deacetylase family protein [Gemmatimonadota bacterium]
MPPRDNPVPRAKAALNWLGGLLVLGVVAGLLIAAAAALWQNVDINSLARKAAAVSDAPPPLPVEQKGPVAVLDRPVEVVLYVNEATRGYFDDPNHLPAAVAEWRRTLGALGWTVDEIGSAAELDALPPETLVIAPEALCLANGEIEAVFRHLRRGGGAVANWAFATRDGQCRWRGWETLRDFGGALDVIEYQAGPGLFVTVPAGLPVSVGMAPGSRIEFYADSHLGLLTGGPHVYWSDWALNSLSTGGESAADAALTLNTTSGGGRAVWLGFRPRQAVGPLDQSRVDRLVRNGLRWAAGLPTVGVSPWPEGRRAGLLIAEDTENGFANAASLARLLREAGLPGTFYAVSQMALEHPEIADSLTGVEIGSHTADHVSPVGLPLAEQQLRLDRSRRELEAWSDQEVLGLRPPEERFDDATLRAWLRLVPSDRGVPYLAAVNGARSASPEIYRYPEGPIVMLPRLLKDDYNVVVQDGTRRPERMLAAYLEGMNKMGALGGFAFVSLHTQIGGTPGQIGVVGAVLDTVLAQRELWWTATGADIARWWLDRDAMRLTMNRVPETDEIVVEVQAPRGTGAREIWLDVSLPLEDMVPMDGDRQLPYARSDHGIRVPLHPLTAGELRTIRLVPAASTEDAVVVGD